MPFEASAAEGNQLTPLGVQQVSQVVPQPTAVWGITGDSDQAAGFAAQIFVTRNGQQRQLASVSMHGANLAGTGNRPMELSQPEVLDPGDMVTVEISNYANVAADVQVVLCCAAVLRK
jgi:hypothetical protein